MSVNRLSRQIQFIVEIDKLKLILRRTVLIDRSRRENSAEHSWHLAMMASTLSEYAEPGTDLLRVLKMLLVHDIVEIDADDTFCYDADANLDKAEREERAATRIFGLLPEDQSAELWALWREFEAQESAEAQFATVLDRLQPFLHNCHTGGGPWLLHGITYDQILWRMQPVEQYAPALWPYVQSLLDEAASHGFLERAV